MFQDVMLDSIGALTAVVLCVLFVGIQEAFIDWLWLCFFVEIVLE